ncbi:MAG: STAS domain-containing protein [Acidobacteriota bacterium]|nr:STAS domain-containing protein [Acidobacteriota bacterium]
MKHFQLRSRILDKVAVIYPRGHLDAHNVERFEQEIRRIMETRVMRIVINCENLDYISSAGMGVIMGYLDEIRENAGDIKLCCVKNQVYDIFDLVGFTDVYDFLKDEETAIQAFA